MTPNIFYPGFPQPRASEQSTEATADNHDIDIIGQRFPLKPFFQVGVIHIVSKIALDLQVLLIAIFP